MPLVEYTFSELLKQFRVRERLNQQELAKLIGVHRNTVVAWEQGSYLPKTRPRVLELAQALHLNEQDTEYLFQASFLSTSGEQQPSDPIAPSQLIQLWNVPYRRNPYFTGREDVLNHLDDVLHAAQNVTLTQPHAISGLGGIGKTQTAVEYAYRFRNDYSAILWVRAETREVLTTDLMAIASLIGLPETNEHNQHRVIEAVKNWLKEHDKWLLILDNVEKIDVIEEFLPNEFSGHVLLTTRSQVTGTIAQRIDLEHMTPEEGAHFLLHRAKLLPYTSSLKNASEPLLSVALTLTQQMGGLPLALDQAGAYIEETGCSLPTFLALLEADTLRLLSGKKQIADYPHSVVTTIAFAFERIQQRNSAAADLLIVCAFLAPDQIPEELIVGNKHLFRSALQEAVNDPFLFNAAMRELLSFSLLQRNSQTNTFTIHRLVQTILRMTMDEDTQHLWAERVVCMVNAVLPDFEELSRWSQAQRYFPHTINCTLLIDTYNIVSLEAANLLYQTGNYLTEQAQFKQAEALLKQAHALYLQLREPEHPNIAACLNDLGEIRRFQGNYTQAEELYKQALMILEKTSGTENSGIASTLNNLGLLYYYQHKYEQAEPFYHRALAIYKTIRGEDDTYIAMSLNNLALLYTRQGKYIQAETLYQQTLTIVEKKLGPEHRRTATSLNNLAKLYYYQGKYEQAEQLYIRVLAIHKAISGEDDPHVALALNNLALLYAHQSKYTQAEAHFQRALQIRIRTLGTEHPRTAQTLSDLASLLFENKEYEQAQQLFQQALAVQQKILERDHPDRITTVERYRQLLSATGQEDQAQLLLK